MPKKKKQTWTDHEKLLEYLVDHSVKQAAQAYKLTEGAIRNRLYTIRKNLRETEKAVNRIKKLQRISERIKKFTITGGLQDDE